MNGNDPILHLEDDLVDVGNLQRALARRGIQTPLRAFPSAEAALAWLRGRDSALPRVRPRLIVLDLGLPAMGGLEFLRTLRSDRALRAIPAVVLTASQRDSDHRRACELGVAGYFVKPIDLDRFVEAVGLIERYRLIVASSGGPGIR
jgi:CheY-like chemotaxis protein